MSTLLQINFTLFSLQIQVTECVLKPKKMVCVGILFSRNEFPYRKPYFAYCTYLIDCTESDSELVMYNERCSLICQILEVKALIYVINDSISQSFQVIE